MNEAELLFTKILNCDRLSLYLNKENNLDKNKSHLISSVLKRRIKGEPIQYILGKTEFMGLELKVNRDVFIPRPETEILVETVIQYVTKSQSQCASLPEGDKVTKSKILDIGTGSGCIAISLAKNLPNIEIVATDISRKALEIAKYNADLNHVSRRIKFVHSDLFTQYSILNPSTPLRVDGESFDVAQDASKDAERVEARSRTINTQYDIIVSNPPYIPTLEIDNLQPEVRYEPRLALDGRSDGIDFHKRIIENSFHCLKIKGFLIMEMGYNQKDDIKNIFKSLDNFEIIEVVKDYNNIERVIIAKLKNNQ